jgi:two-component system NtrC family sensor kinase
MKEFAHPGGQEKLSVDLNRALESTLAVSAHEYRLVADVETDFGSVPPVACYIGELNQVFLNIIVNASHAIADVVGSTGARGTIRVATRLEGSNVQVSISDTGGGIPKSVGDRIFEPFFTTKEFGKGTGQGLSIARTIVEKHGGELRFEAEAGVGTTFFVCIPLA